MTICVTNRILCKDDFLERLREIARAKPDAILLREKALPESEYAALAKECNAICKTVSVPLICNTFYNVAADLQIPVQLPFPVLMGNTELLSIPFGVSIHTTEEAIQAEQRGATFLIAGHVFPTSCKKDLPPRGLDFLHSVCEAVSIPVFGIGGITSDNAAHVRHAGAAGICVMSALMETAAPYETTKQLIEAAI